jgi:uncharacterized protein DUF4129
MAQQLPETMIQDTVAAVFSDRAYHRLSLLQRFLGWLGDKIAAFFNRLEMGSAPTPVFWTIVGLIALAAIILLLRWDLRRLAGRMLAHGRAAADRAALTGDPWELARRHAGQADYTRAAHALYAGLLTAIAGHGELELHESKTIGDYLRELVVRSSALVARFREFARSYEVVIYGIGFCDRDRYERLLTLADRMVDRGRVPVVIRL